MLSDLVILSMSAPMRSGGGGPGAHSGAQNGHETCAKMVRKYFRGRLNILRQFVLVFAKLLNRSLGPWIICVFCLGNV